MDQVSLIVPCAGSGERIGGQAKQLRVIAGKPICIHSIQAFVPFVDEIIIPCSDDIRCTLQEHLNTYHITAQLVCGGKNRFESVWSGIQGASSDKVLIHDAVRPGIDADAIKHCIQALDQHPAVVTAMPCPDSLKRATHGLVVENIDRDGVYLAQTPQGLRLSATKDLYAQAIASGHQFTDDVSLCQAHGLTVAIAPGKRRYLKVTYPEDLTIVESLLTQA